MSDEKRQTRLLPFRLRRAGATRHTYDRRDEDAGSDADLSALLRTWDAPRQSSLAHARLLADFRASSISAPLWRRALTTSVRVPLPLAACAVVALLASLVGVGARTSSSRTAQAQPQASSIEPIVRVVEVPVVQERVVTRVVYVEKNARDESRVVSAKSETAARLSAMSESASKSDVNASEPASFITRVDMADFRPADEVKIRVIKKGSTDEK